MEFKEGFKALFKTEQAMFSSIMKNNYNTDPRKVKYEGKPNERKTAGRKDEEIFMIEYPQISKNNSVRLIGTRKRLYYDPPGQIDKGNLLRIYEDLKCEYKFNNVKISFCDLSNPKDCCIVYSVNNNGREEILARVYESGKATFNDLFDSTELQDVQVRLKDGKNVFVMDIIEELIRRNPNYFGSRGDIIGSFHTIISRYKPYRFSQLIPSTKDLINNSQINNDIKEKFLGVIDKMYLKEGDSEAVLSQFIEELNEIQRFIRKREKCLTEK